MDGNRYLEREGMRRLLGWCLALASLVANTSLADYEAYEDSGDGVVDVMTRFWDWYDSNGYRYYIYPNEDPCSDYITDLVVFGDWIGQGYPGEPPTHPMIEISTNLWRLWYVQSNEVYSFSEAISVIADYTNTFPGGLMGIPEMFTKQDYTRFRCHYVGASVGLWDIIDSYQYELITPSQNLMTEIGDILRVHLQQNSISFDAENPGWESDGYLSSRWQDHFLYPTNDFIMNSLGLHTDDHLGGGSQYEFPDQKPGMEYAGNDIENTDKTMFYDDGDGCELVEDYGIGFLGYFNRSIYAKQGIRDYSFQKMPHTARRGSFSMRDTRVAGTEELHSFSWGGGYMPKITVLARTWRNVAYINLRIPCSGDWGWYCYPADTMYDDERGEWTTAKRFYTEITIKLENPSDPDVAKSYGVDAQMKILVKDNGKIVHENDFNRGKQLNGTGFLSRPEYPEPPSFLR